VSLLLFVVVCCLQDEFRLLGASNDRLVILFTRALLIAKKLKDNNLQCKAIIRVISYDLFFFFFTAPAGCLVRFPESNLFPLLCVWLTKVHVSHNSQFDFI
jgi:hypothetical protein